MATIATSDFAIHDFLLQERSKDILRFSTAGSVDDGKSTLIGRLLYDTQSVYEDQVRSIEGKGTTAPGQIDFALLTDGLRAEREQGITIDVAYRYFSTPRRKFIIADTPGHEQYTRNMATGASTADAAVVLIDASKGVLIQSRRHAYIASLLRVRNVIVAVNKMDLIGYEEAAFRAIERDFTALLQQIATDTGSPVASIFVPVSALVGDNIVHRTDAMPWYTGPSLLELLESVPSSHDTSQATRTEPFRLPVQRVLRPDHTFRGFAGQIASGTIHPGDKITALPSGRNATVKRIVTYDGDLEEAHAPLSITLVLDRELDISRGDLIVAQDRPSTVAKSAKAALVWMDQRPLDRKRRYLLKHTSHTVPAFVSSIEHRNDIATLSHIEATTLEMNEIGVVNIELLRAIALDAYSDNRATGAFILIDPETNSTVAAGMMQSLAGAVTEQAFQNAWGAITSNERAARWGHRGAVIELSGPSALIDAIERSLFTVGAVTTRIEAEEDVYLLHPQLLEAVTRLQVQSGLLALVVRENQGRENQGGENQDEALIVRVEEEQIMLDGKDVNRAIAAVHRLLETKGVFYSSEKAGL